MEIVKSSIFAGMAATVVLTVFLFVADLLLGGVRLFVFATFTSLCAIGGPPYCELGSPMATAITYFWFVALFAIAWPLLFGGFTWGIPGESGLAHGAIFGLVLWTGYAATVVYRFVTGEEVVAETLLVAGIILLGYLVYGLVLGGVYDRLAEHRTFMSVEGG